jgi:hypothetical protein
MKRVLVLALLLVVACGKEEKKKEELAAAQASASAAAAAESAALAKTLASVSATPAKIVEPPAGEWITAQHILVAYAGARACPRGVTRSKDEAKKRADEAREKAKDPKLEFTDLVNIYSDDNATKDRQGSLGKIKKTSVVKEFADAAWALKVDGISDVVETQFGFHIIKRNQ